MDGIHGIPEYSSASAIIGLIHFGVEAIAGAMLVFTTLGTIRFGATIGVGIAAIISTLGIMAGVEDFALHQLSGVTMVGDGAVEAGVVPVAGAEAGITAGEAVGIMAIGMDITTDGIMAIGQVTMMVCGIIHTLMAVDGEILIGKQLLQTMIMVVVSLTWAKPNQSTLL